MAAPVSQLTQGAGPMVGVEGRHIGPKLLHDTELLRKLNALFPVDPDPLAKLVWKGTITPDPGPICKHKGLADHLAMSQVSRLIGGAGGRDVVRRLAQRGEGPLSSGCRRLLLAKRVSV